MNIIGKSESIRAGLRKGFQDGTSKMAQRRCYGYDTGPDGELVIDPDEAAVVRWIFDRYTSGDSLGKIAAGLEEQGIPSPTGRPKWNREAINKLLSNEKYVGDAILQKTFSEDLFDRRQVKNEGQLPKYYVHDCHPAIIDRVTFQRVQEEVARRSSLRKTSSKNKTEQGKHSRKYVLSGLLVCSECGSPYRCVTYMPNGQKRFVWRCSNRIEHGKRICHDSATMEEPELRDTVVSALNELFRQRTAKELLAQCISAALAGTEDGDLTLPAVEARLKALQEEQMSLLQLAMDEPDCMEYDRSSPR